MDYVINNWGSIVGVLGLVASIGGLVVAFLARRAAKSAERAASKARRAITRTLSIVDIERAKSLIERLKGIHYRRNWDYALGQYPELRGILSDIVASAPENFALHVDSINSEIPRVTALERFVRRARYENENGEPKDIPGLDETLSEIQQSLEMRQSSMMYTDETVSS